ncbi:hypothetical protein SAZ10_04205 [Mesorhizobium sp. BAC0120]|uniref:hypothetical protein n=1 Tax=Mesorhizobium sp. BAC0120 TaxID=3090670 RepID=UPI00298D5B1B|nr:hypothetical protein [Mesorhizobium sp. BAC0120]MDW6020960.1 hypothetical protein [Mesorhizobium sp. BAC0120]
MFVGTFLKIVGGLVTAATMLFIVLVLLVQLGVVNPYPTPPNEAMNLPYFGRSAAVELGELRRRDGEPLPDYQERLVHGVNAWMVHYWPAEDRSFVGVSPFDLYPLWLKSFFPGYEHFADYEFITPDLAWHRGYGYCSQVSRIVYSVLRDQGIGSVVVHHPNHVVVESAGHVLDADYGVFIPRSLKEMRDNLGLVDTYYGPTFQSMVPLLRSIYRQGWMVSGSDAQFDAARRVETEAIVWKWRLLVIALWVSVAALDAGLCWPRFWRSVGPILSSSRTRFRYMPARLAR